MPPFDFRTVYTGLIAVWGGRMSHTKPQDTSSPPIYVVSGGMGASGEQLALTALAQFPEADVPVMIVSHVREIAQIEAVVNRAADAGGTTGVNSICGDQKNRRKGVMIQSCPSSARW